MSFLILKSLDFGPGIKREMLYSYYVICRLTRRGPKGKFIDRTMKVTARSVMGALSQALIKIKQSSEKDVVSIRVDWRNPMPTSRPRKKKYKRKKPQRDRVVYDGLTRIR